VITGPKFVPPPKRITATSVIEILVPRKDVVSKISSPNYASAGRVTEVPKPLHDVQGILAPIAIDEKALSSLPDLVKPQSAKEEVATTSDYLRE
jgi:hypothetical protein